MFFPEERTTVAHLSAKKKKKEKILAEFVFLFSFLYRISVDVNVILGLQGGKCFNVTEMLYNLKLSGADQPKFPALLSQPIVFRPLQCNRFDPKKKRSLRTFVFLSSSSAKPSQVRPVPCLMASIAPPSVDVPTPVGRVASVVVLQMSTSD